MGEESPSPSAAPVGAAFISYASEDARAAERIADALRAAGIEVWFDKSELRGGDAWDRQIRKQIHDCALFLPVISAHSDARGEGYFRREWKLAVDRTADMAEDVAFLLPVVIDSTPEATARVPDRFREVQWSQLQDGQATPAFVQRVVRLLAPGRSTTSRPTASGAVPSIRELVPPSRQSRPKLPAVVAVVILLALAYLLVEKLWISKHPVPTQAPDLGQQATSSAGAAPVAFSPPPHSIAVLPFVNMSGDKDQDYFSDGLTEELLNDLARINELQVAARTSAFSFRGKEADIATIARKLNVGAVLEGSVRRSGRRIRVTAQLNNAVTGFHIWSQTYDRAVGDALIVQTEIASAVASALKVTLLGDRNARIEAGGTRSGTAFDAYARGLKAYSNAQDDEGLSNAVSDFSEAIKLDPNFALAYAARSIALTSFDNLTPEMIEKARADAHRAISLAPELAEGHLALSVLLEQVLDLPGANQEVEQALALAPGSVRMLRHYGILSVFMGRTESGLAAAHRAVLLDPLNFDAYGYLAASLLFAHHYDEAIAAAQKARELSSKPAIPLAALQGLAYYAEGDYRAAREACEIKSEIEQDIHRACLAMAYEKLGQHADAQAELTKIKASSGNESAYYCAEVHTQWGNRAEALDCLDTAMRLRNPDLERLKTDPLMDPLRKEPRFQAIERELKFPQ